jgi:acyl carrier protein
LGESAAGEKILVAYCVKAPAREVDPKALRQVLRERLPEYMVPAAWVFMEHLPLTVNGKLDLKALPRPDFPEPVTAPMTPTLGGSQLERSIAAIWCEVLQLPAVALEQNFFDVGGNSMNLVEVHDKLQASLGHEVAITDLFAHATVRGLALHLSAPQPRSANASAAAVRAQRQREALSTLRNSRRPR